MIGTEVLASLLKATWSIVKTKTITLIPTFIVPVFVGACIFGQFAGASITGNEEPISAISLPLAVDPMAKASQEGALVLIMDPEAGQFAIPWKSGSLRRYWISLDPDLLRLNSGRLRIGPGHLEGEFPLFGVGQPVVMVLEGVDAEKLTFAGRGEAISLRDMRIYSETSRSIALAGFVISMFSLGLIIRPAEEGWDVTD